MSNHEISILMVDDRPENLLALEAVLSDMHYQLIKARSGEEALKLLLKHDFSLILLDVQMPGLNGFETAHLIKEHPKTKDIPIIFITAISKEAENVNKGYSLGAIDYIFKPFDPETLRSKIFNLANIQQTNRLLMEQSEKLQKAALELQTTNNELVLTTSKLRKAEAMARVIGDTSIDSMITFDEMGLILSANPAFERMFHYSCEEIISKPLTALLTFAKEEFPDVESTMYSIEGFLYKLIETIAIRKEGDTFFSEIQIGKTYIDEKAIYACTIRDITERKQQMEELKYKALHDELTDLPNRTLLYDRMVQALEAKNDQHVLIILDLDEFKAINDTLGHQQGDVLLKHVANRLRKEIHSPNTVARLGGDEFAIFIPNTSLEQAIAHVEKIAFSLETPFELEGQAFTIHPSLGVSIYPEHGQEVDTLMRRADIAMYTAKRMGLGYSVYTSDKEENKFNNLIMMSDLKRAIAKDQLSLHYQPKINIKTNEIIGVEALVRWIHPTLGFIGPDQFIPIAEKSGLIKSLTLHVLKKAIIQCNKWKTQGLNWKVSVNISTRHLLDIRLPDLIGQLLEKYELPASYLILEITESFIMLDPTRSMIVLKRLEKMGIKLSIDDFGTGYSSLAYLKKLPIQEIKVDKSFVKDMVEDNNDEVIVRAIISLAHSLGLEVVAEGVENQQVLSLLKSLDCDIVQGYHLCKPKATEELMKWLNNQQEFS